MIPFVEERAHHRSPHGDRCRGRVATGTAYELPQGILRDLLDDFILVDDMEILQAMALLIEKAHTLAEGAGATPLAGAIKDKERLKGKKVALSSAAAM